MTTRDLGRGVRSVPAPAPAPAPNPPTAGPTGGATTGALEPALVEDDLGGLFESSPARPVHTSAAAEIGFLAGLVSVVASPFSLMLALCLGLGAVGLLSSILGLARSSRARVAGSLLASVGLVLSLATLAVVGLRYAGLDTAVGDSFAPTLVDWLTWLNALVPRP